jgi:hypothetical protein
MLRVDRRLRQFMETPIRPYACILSFHQSCTTGAAFIRFVELAQDRQRQRAAPE